MKGLLSDLLEDSGLTFTVNFNENLNSDPRAKFLKETSPPQDFAKELQWKSGSLGSLMNQSTLNQIKSTLNTVKSALKRIKSLLDAVKTFIEILSELLELAEDLFAAVLETVIGQIEKVINNISSTGVYFLPLWELYLRKTKTSKTIADIISSSNTGLFKTEDESGKKWEANHDVSNKNFDADLQETNKLLYDEDNRRINVAANIENQKSGNEENNLLDTLLPFRSTDYQEFIENIINCLTDEDDVPYAGDFSAFSKNTDKLPTFKEVFGATTYATFTRPGAPTWSSGTTVKIMIGAVTFPAPETFRGAGIAFATLILKLLKTLRKFTGKNNISEIGKRNSTNKDEVTIKNYDPESFKKIEELRSKFTDNLAEKIRINSKDKTDIVWTREKEIDAENKQILKQIEKIVQESNVASSGIQYYINQLELYLGIADASNNNNDSTSAPEVNEEGGGFEDWWESIKTVDDESLADYTAGLNDRIGMPPNFWGISLGSIFPGVFTYLKFLLDKLRKWNRKQDGPTLAEVFDEWLKWFEEKIKEIEDIIFLIDQIVELIDAILGISLTYLIIDTTNGIPDIIAQLQSADGFPNEDKNQVILGFLAGFGFPNPNDPSLNLSEYFGSISNEFNQDAQDLISDLKLQNESDGIGIINKILPK
jgi:hypothetical protein